MANWYDSPYHFRGYLWLWKPTPIFKARIDAPDGYIYPTRELNFDGVTLGDYADVKPGQTVYIGSTDGAYDLGRQRIKSAHPTNLQIGWSSLGIHDGEVKLPDNAYITVVDLRLIWMKPPYIEIASGRMWKDQDVGFVAAEAQPPVANIGVGDAQFVDETTGVTTVEFDSTNSYPVAPGSILGAVLWDVVDGVITVGTDTDQIITVEFPPGKRYVSLTVTDDGGRSHTAYAPIISGEPTGENAPIYDFEVTNHQLTPEGSKISFLVREPIPTTDYPDGTLVIYTEDEWYSNVKGSINGYPNRQHVKFVGFIHGEPTQVEAGELVTTQQVILDCVDVAGKLATLPGFSQVVRRAASPANWLEMAGANTDRYLHYLLHWHSTALELTDFYLSATGDTYQFISFTSDGANFYAQVDGRAQATGTGFRLTSDSQGIMRVLADPMFQEAGDRISDTQADFDESHLLRYGYSKQRPPRVHWTRTTALTTSASELTLQNVVHSIAPGAAPGQGETSEVLGNRLVVSQAESNIFTGAAYERSNAPESMFDIDVANGGVQIEPAFMTWIRLTTTSRYAAQRGLIFTLERFLPANVSIARNSANGSKRISLTAERELFGNIAATYIPPTANLPGYTEPSVYFGEVLDVIDTGFAGIGNFGFIAEDGYLYRGDFALSAWEQYDLGLTGTPRSFSVDAYSPKYLGTGDDVNGWVATSDASNVFVYYVEGIFATTPTVTLKFTSASTPRSGRYVNIVSERITQNEVCVLWYSDTDGTMAAWTDDNTTFNEVTVSPHLGDGVEAFPAAYLIGGGLIWAGAFSATGSGNAAAAKIYRSDDKGATWAISHGDPLGELGLSLHVPFYNNDARNKMWYTKWDWGFGAGDRQVLYYYDGTTENMRAPVLDGVTFGSATLNRGVSTNPTNSAQVACVGRGFDGADHIRVFLSNDEGLTWQPLTEENLNYVSCDLNGNGDIYVWGENVLSYFPAGDWVEQDHTGNIFDDFGFNSLIIGIFGG